MPPTRQEYASILKKPSVQERDIAVSLLETAAVRAVELTGHPGWDRFLEQCQALLNQAEKDLAAWTENTINAYKDEDMRFAQRNVTQFKAQVELLKKIMQLPGEIVKERHATQS
jgi:hypothetical protein